MINTTNLSVEARQLQGDWAACLPSVILPPPTDILSQRDAAVECCP
jgi:hypothetical protein